MIDIVDKSSIEGELNLALFNLLGQAGTDKTVSNSQGVSVSLFSSNQN
jgi:hypothetical protein